MDLCCNGTQGVKISVPLYITTKQYVALKQEENVSHELQKLELKIAMLLLIAWSCLLLKN